MSVHLNFGYSGCGRDIEGVAFEGAPSLYTDLAQATCDSKFRVSLYKNFIPW